MESRLVVTIDGRGAQSGARDTNSAIDSVRKNARDMTQQLESSFNSLKQSLFSVGGAIAGIGIGDFVRRAIGSFVEFERGLANISKTTDITGQALQDLGSQIIDMSKRIPVARDQLVNIAAAAGQLGVEGSANILKFTETVAKLQFASNLSGEDAATILARVINVAGEDISSVDRLASSIVYLGRSSAATESEIAHMVIELSKGTAQFHVASANLVGLGTTLREFGQQPELVRTSILRVFLEMKDAIDQGGGKLKELSILTGMTGDQFKKSFQQDAFGAFLAFIGGLKSVIEQGGNASRTLAALGLNGTEINAVIPLLAVNFDKLTQRVGEANKAYRENTDLTNVAQKAFDTTAGKIQILKNAFNEFLRKIGEEAAPAFNQLLDKLIVFANSDAALVFGKALAAVMQLVADHAELLGIALGLIAINRTITFFALLTTVGLNTARALRAGTIEAIANATGMAEAARSANLYMITGEKVATSTGKASIATKAAAAGVYLLNSALSLVGINGPAVVTTLTNMGASISGFLGRLAATQVVSAIAAAGMEGLSVAVAGLGIAFDILLGPIGLVALAIAAIIAAFELYKDTIVNIGPLNASVGNIVQATWNVVSQRVSDSLSELGGFISDGLSHAADVAGQVFSGLADAISGVWDSVKEAAGNAFDAVSETVSSAVNGVLDYFGGLLEPIAAVFSGIYDAISNALKAAADYIAEAVNAITGIFQGMYSAVAGVFQSLKNYIVDIFGGVIDYFRGLVNDIIGEANRLQSETDKAKSGSTSKAADGSGGAAASVSNNLPPKVEVPKVDLGALNNITNKAGKGGKHSLSDDLKKLRNNADDKLADAGQDELSKRLNDVDQAIRNTVGSYDKLSAVQRKNVEDTKQQIIQDYQLEHSRTEIKKIIEDTLTPQEKYNKAIDELNKLQPTTAQGFEAIRRKAEELRKELQSQDPVLKENKRLTEQFNTDFEGAFKNGLQSVFTKGKAGWKDMLSGFKDLYFKTLTEVASRPIMDALLGQKDASGQRGGGLLSDFISKIFSGGGGLLGGGGSGGNSGGGGGGFGGLLGSLFGGGQQQQQQTLPWLKPGANDNFGQSQGQSLAQTFGEESASSTGFLGQLGNLFSPSGAGGGFLSNLGNLFSSATSGLSGIFSGIGGLFSGLFGGGGGGGLGGILNFASSALSLIGLFADGGSVGARTPIIVGERGPELFIPPVNGEIISNDVFMKASRAANDNIPRGMSKEIVALAMAGKFGGFRADGGSVMAGMTYAGGERGRELYVPNMPAGGAANGNNPQGGDTIVVHLNVNTQDATSFRRSQGQIAADAARAISRAKRNL